MSKSQAEKAFILVAKITQALLSVDTNYLHLQWKREYVGDIYTQLLISLEETFELHGPKKGYPSQAIYLDCCVLPFVVSI